MDSMNEYSPWDEAPQETAAMDDDALFDVEAGDEQAQDAPGEGNANGIKVVYNGREQEISLSDAPALIQKGMNYDHVHKELEALRESAGVKNLKEHAAKNGVTYEEYVEALERTSFARELEALKQKGVQDRSDELLAQAQELSRGAETTNRAREQYARFARENPGVDIASLPKDILRAPYDGGDMQGAYLSYRNALLTAELAALKNHESAKSRSAGSATGEGEGDDRSDELWRAFMG